MGNKNKLKQNDGMRDIKKIRKKVQKWKNFPEEMAPSLYIAHKFLTSQKGQRTDPYADNYICYTWTDYCKDIGINVKTAKNWIKKFKASEGKNHNGK